MHIEIVSIFSKTQEISLNSFAYLSVPKFTLEFHVKVNEKSDEISIKYSDESPTHSSINTKSNQLIINNESKRTISSKDQINTLVDDSWSIQNTKKDVFEEMEEYKNSLKDQNNFK